MTVPVDERMRREVAGADRLAGALEAALRTDEGLRARLCHARTSVAFRLAGDGRAVTLLLDRDEPAVVLDEPAEVTVQLDGAAAERLAEGRLALPAAVVSGAVRAEGPALRLLEVEPMLRTALRAVAEERGAPVTQETRPAPPPATAAGPLDPSLLAIETRDLRKAFGPTTVLSGLDLQVPAGVVSVVLGPSGTGKSVLLQHVIGLMRPDGGEVLIRGRALSRMSRAEVLDLRSEIGVMFQDGALFSAMDVYDNVAFPLRQHTDLDEDEVRQVVERHLADVGLLGAAHRMPNQLSGGMRKRAGLARALVMDPGIVLCDEPDSGLDPVRTALLGDLLADQHAQYGGTMVVVTHDVALARRIADHVSIVWRGQVLESGLADAVFASETPFVRQFLSGTARGPLGMDA
ncbi:ABC transporter ATP-binding protein [Conexibacter sp. SYSU D00693]|uniref:ABC transporter ATP-binding protein n=1 Tax=Conexibacter sp. SYSU D00693 TaxID=2812560 RepID=UPI00196AA6CD|nr:ATP-binding cassette domain-containing protein [Conexibacter sp. SYSU D00693]